MIIQGKLTLELCEKPREMAANFSFIEMVEVAVVKKPITQLIHEATAEKMLVSDLVNVIYCGLRANNNDTRLSKSEIGEYVVKKGTVNFIEPYLELLTYALTGESMEEAAKEVDDTLPEDKKK